MERKDFLLDMNKKADEAAAASCVQAETDHFNWQKVLSSVDKAEAEAVTKAVTADEGEDERGAEGQEDRHAAGTAKILRTIGRGCVSLTGAPLAGCTSSNLDQELDFFRNLQMLS